MLLDRCPWYIAGPLLGVVIVGPWTHRHVARFSRQHRGGDDLLRYGGRIGACVGVAHLEGIVNTKVIGLFAGVVFGFTLAWARLTDPRIIRDMLLLKEAHVFLIMGSAVAIAAIGVRALKASGARCLVTGEPV